MAPVDRTIISVNTDRSAPADLHRSAQARFAWRLAEQFFRRWPMYVVPFLAITALGVVRLTGLPVTYESVAHLSTSTNPLLPVETRSNSGYTWETPSAGTTRVIAEQLSTEAFAGAVAEAAGLQPALDAGLIDLDDVRAAILVKPTGDTLFQVSAEWSEPIVAHQLVIAVVEEFVNYLIDTESSDSRAAVDFYTAVRTTAEEASAAAQEELDAYLRANPAPVDSDERPIDQVLRIQRLNNAIDRAEADVATAQQNIQAAQLQVAQANSEAGQRVRVVDAPYLPDQPLSQRIPQILTGGVFFVLGLALVSSALLVSTLVDRSVRSEADVEAACGLALATTVPYVDRMPGQRRRARPARRGVRRPAEPKADVPSTPEPAAGAAS